MPQLGGLAMQRIPALSVRFLVAAAVTAAAMGTALARTPYDGRWSVVVTSQSGNCEMAYRYGLKIDNGSIFYQGEAPINLSGRVDGRGHVRVSIRYGRQAANAVGRLSRASGGGTWRGRSRHQQCAGHWQARRL